MEAGLLRSAGIDPEEESEPEAEEKIKAGYDRLMASLKRKGQYRDCLLYTSANNQYGEHYTACETCSRNQKPAGVVFVTEQGNHYHNLETCSGLKRTVRMVKETETSGMKCCSRCG